MTIEFSVAQARLGELIQEFSPIGELSNEAQTRFSFIDRLLTDCLGWTRESIKVEVYEQGERSDYECGCPRQLIVEAKKAAKSFAIPPRGKKASIKIKIRSLMDFNAETKAGIEQVHKYCQDRGVQIAALCNGPQLVVFLASRLDGVSPMDGDALVFDSYEAITHGFSTVFECLSQDGVQEKRLVNLLGGKSSGNLPSKLSTACLNYFDYKYSSAFQENIRNASSLVIEDIGRTVDLEKQFLKECYCESGPLTQYSLLGKNILSTRYAALFSKSETGSRVEEINPRKQKSKLSDKVLAEALARRPIVFLGDVGVGKTSFIKNLIQIDAAAEFGDSIFVYFDLGSKGALSQNTRDALLQQIESTLRSEYLVNLQDKKLLEDIYQVELAEFDNGFMAPLRDSQPTVFQQKRIEHIQSLISNRAEFLRNCLSKLAEIRKCQIVIVIDNADQRSVPVQNDAFVIAHELASTWNALVFLSLRPQTFHTSKRSGAVSAYPPKVFVISPPKLEDVIEKRLSFALRIAEGRLPVSNVRSLSMHVESLAILIKALQSSLRSNPELYEFIVNVSSGNVRVAIELISKFLGNPNVHTERIVQIFNESGDYRIPLHEFSKGGLLGDYAYYQEDASIAFNVFGIVYADKREHFLSLLILGYLACGDVNIHQADGFVSLDLILREIQTNGFTEEQVTAHLKRLTRKKLLETTERRLLETEQEVREVGMPDSFRITPLGAYHLKKWSYEFAFVEAMSFDTPIFDEVMHVTLLKRVNEQTLSARYERAVAFLNYLNSVWTGFSPKPYFNWAEKLLIGKESFDRVEKRLMDVDQLH
ncbi:MAG: hypothetical protein KJ795_02310 [Gammaproteobacteria bacterium]|nr:hypothetical protein [Gammaproteobacteria bacterium]MBU1775550.1 hypothetical protein [Gammaproteobacteria bacterium]MBU1967600.1 hypothetical protein [Gammaproteobacteria bacterium]